MHSYYLLLFSALFVFITSCSSDTELTSDRIQHESKEQETELIDSDTLNESGVNSKTTVPFVLASDGLEYKVVQHYLEKYKSGNLRSVENGIPKVMDPTSHTVYIENTLYDNSDLGFFMGKYPEFLEQPTTAYSGEKGEVSHHEKVNCKEFQDIKALDFFNNKEQLNGRDLLLIVSKAFYHNGAYYVHVWQLSNDKVIHQREGTYKFDATGEIVNQSYKNYYQLGYNGIENFLDKLKEKK